VLVDHAGYFLNTTDHTIEILEAVDSPNVKMCYDIYHQQITEGNIIRNIRNNIDRIGHFHVGDNPGRKQPGTGELNYKNIFKAIHETGYDGFVALECGNTASLEEALTYLREYCLTW
jgi:hydroxypyruvate isomerase